MKKSILILFCFVLLGIGVSAQDVHFSQYYASPLTLNPALTGKFNGVYRVTAIYRDQWRATQNTNAYMTPSASVDFSLFKHKLKTDAFGIGIVALYDKVAQLQTMKAGLSVAYHKGLDKKGNYHLALGMQANYINRSIGDDLYFEDEIIDPTLTQSQDEDLLSGADHSVDMNVGGFFDAKFTDWMTFYAGYTYFNLLKHEDDLIDNTTGDGVGETPGRHVIHGGMEFEIAKKWLVIPGALYQTTVKAKEVNMGVTFGYKLMSQKQKTTTLLLGGWYRMATNSIGNNGAAIVKGGVDFQNFRITGAYDFGLAQLNQDSKDAVGKMPNAFEIAISYFAGQQTSPKTNTYLFNPRF
ncbi:MAG: PorP/SprF family type IX secretion system membrane protein [Chitinophagales bacterium]